MYELCKGRSLGIWQIISEGRSKIQDEMVGKENGNMVSLNTHYIKKKIVMFHLEG